MVKYETFNLCYMGSNPIDLNLLHLIVTIIIYNIDKYKRPLVNGRPFVFQTICVDSNSAGRKKG